MERLSVWLAMDLKKRRKILAKKKKIHDLIKRASSSGDPLSPFNSFRRYRRNDLSVYLESGRGDRLSSSVKQHIRKLLQTNMEGFYGSDWPIQAKVKRKEMSSADAHYIFVRELSYDKAYETSTRRVFKEGCNQIAGFVHYRFTLEEEIPVLYVYEIQLESRFQGKGLGEFLMQLIELIASKNRMSAIVLTVLTSNALAMTFYMSKLGYRISSISPSKANLPTFPAKYEILCKTFDFEAKSVLEMTTNLNQRLSNNHGIAHSCTTTECCDSIHLLIKQMLSDENLVPPMAVHRRNRKLQNSSNA